MSDEFEKTECLLKSIIIPQILSTLEISKQGKIIVVLFYQGPQTDACPSENSPRMKRRCRVWNFDIIKKPRRLRRGGYVSITVIRVIFNEVIAEGNRGLGQVSGFQPCDLKYPACERFLNAELRQL